ncbi:MAG TPA: hypothetical protein VMJ10_16000 [Kofleriaceae bacterium]|nr:hypothetical protein [Kofleriaceae bacterium]
MTELGAALRAAGLHARALAAWAGTDRLSALGELADRPAATPAAAVLALFVAGADVPAALLPRLDLDAIADAGLIERAGDRVRATVSLLPLGESLLACDRCDAPPARELACWPDDSSYHLARAIPPGRRTRWIDLGTGSAFAPLARPALADAIVAADLNPRAVELATLGAALSRLDHVRAVHADLGASLAAGAELVTCNAPIPARGHVPGEPMWRATADDFVVRLFVDAARLVADSGLVVVHAALDALAPVVAALPGERVVVAYTPARAPREFAVAWWRPGGDARHVAARRALDAARPHVDHGDRDAALAGALPPL